MLRFQPFGAQISDFSANRNNNLYVTQHKLQKEDAVVSKLRFSH